MSKKKTKHQRRRVINWALLNMTEAFFLTQMLVYERQWAYNVVCFWVGFLLVLSGVYLSDDNGREREQRKGRIMPYGFVTNVAYIIALAATAHFWLATGYAIVTVLFEACRYGNQLTSSGR